MSIIKKLKMWWSGNSLEREIMLRAAELCHKKIDLPLKPPKIKLFWLNNWKVLMPIIVGAVVALFIHFDSKSISKKAANVQNEKVTVKVVAVKT